MPKGKPGPLLLAYVHKETFSLLLDTPILTLQVSTCRDSGYYQKLFPIEGYSDILYHERLSPNKLEALKFLWSVIVGTNSDIRDHNDVMPSDRATSHYC